MPASAPQNLMIDKWLVYSTGAVGCVLLTNVLGMVRPLKISERICAKAGDALAADEWRIRILSRVAAACRCRTLPTRTQSGSADGLLAPSMASSMGWLPVALPRLPADFGADRASVQWILNAFMLPLASLTLIGRALGDVYGKARMLALGCLLFALASAACAFAPSLAWLIAARVVQGAAAAIVTAASLALIGAIYLLAERNRAICVWAGASTLITAGGSVLGGWLTDTETYGWPSVF